MQFLPADTTTPAPTAPTLAPSRPVKHRDPEPMRRPGTLKAATYTGLAAWPLAAFAACAGLAVLAVILGAILLAAILAAAASI